MFYNEVERSKTMDNVFEQIYEAVELFLNLDTDSRASAVDLLKSEDKCHGRKHPHSETEK